MGTTAQTQQPTEILGTSQFQSFIDAALNFKANSEWKGDKRLFLTFLPNSASVEGLGIPYYDYTIRTTITGSYNNAGGAKRTFDLAELSTGEISTHSGGTTPPYFTINSKYNYNQNYTAKKYSGVIEHNFDHKPPIFVNGSYMISRMNDTNPSLLIQLNKDQQLPEGTGDKEFIIIPENLHPFIKDNLEYFLTQAGINIGGDTSPLIKLNESRRKLK